MATTTEQAPATGLQRRASAEITTPAEYEQSLRTWQAEHAHILTPAVSFSDLPPQSALVASKICLNPDPKSGGDVYQDGLFIKGEDVAIAKVGLSKIAQCAGISVDTERTDSRTVQFFWEVKATATWVGFDGTPQRCTGTVEYDLRDGSPRLKGFSAAQIDQARKFGLAGAETRAINRAIRQFGVKQKYTKTEIQKPFVVVRVVFRPDMNDPVQRAIVTQQRMAGTTALYPHAGGGTALPPPVEEPRATVIDGHVVSDAKPVSPTPAPVTAKAATTAIDEMPSAAAGPVRYTVTKVLKQKQEDGSFRFFLQTEQTIDSLLETNEPIAIAAAAAKKASRAVELDLEKTSTGTQVIELREVSEASGTELPADARFVADVREKTGKTNGRDWVKYTIVFTDGAEGTTFSATIAKDAHDAKDGHLPVRATFSTNEKYPDQQNVEELAIIDTRQGALPLTTEL